jgi:hypothetical protein
MSVSDLSLSVLVLIGFGNCGFRSWFLRLF